MLNFIWIEILKKPIFNSLVFLELYTGNLGISIILLTLILKTILVPLSIPQLRLSLKKGDMDEDLKKLKEKHKDKSELAKAQMDLYKKHGVSPAGGCLPSIVFMIILLALFNVFRGLFDGTIDPSFYYSSIILRENPINHYFLYLDLFKKDPYYILPVLTGIAQFFASKYMMPKVKAAEKIAKKTESGVDDIATQMQSQMLYMFPIMTVFFTINFPSGLALYWFVSSLYTILQNWALKKYIIKG